MSERVCGACRDEPVLASGGRCARCAWEAERALAAARSEVAHLRESLRIASEAHRKEGDRAIAAEAARASLEERLDAALAREHEAREATKAAEAVIEDLRANNASASLAMSAAEATAERLLGALRTIGGLACYRDGVDSYTTLGGRMNAIAVQVREALAASTGKEPTT